MANEDFSDLDPGDETRRHGDYIGLPHPVADGTAYDDIDASTNPVGGHPVVYDGTDIATAASTDTNVVGVVFTLPVSGDSSRSGPYVEGDEEATVKTSGTVVADFSNAGGVAEADEGTYWDDGSQVYLLNVFDASNDIAEVLLK